MAVQRHADESLTGPITDREITLPIAACSKCGQQHVRNGGIATCRGHVKRRDNAPCLGWRMTGQEVCTKHGGWSKQAKAKAVERVARAEVQNTAGIFGIPRQVDPAVGLIEEWYRTNGIVAQLERIVSALPQESLTFGTVEQVDTEGARDWPTDKSDGSDQMTIHLGGVSIDLPSKSLVPSERKTTKRAAVSIWVKLFAEERDRLIRLGEIITRLGLEAQRDAYVRDQAVLMADVLGQLNLTKDQRRKAAELLRGMGAA